MDRTRQLDTALSVFARLGVDVREAHLGGQSGGLCTIHGQRVFFVDLDADVATRWDRCLAALAAMDELDRLYLPPALREPLDRRRDGEE